MMVERITMDDLISIIVPVYNVEDYLPRCIDSITSQTYSNVEIILVDDGSTDSSGEICDAHALIDQRIKVFHVDNGGQSRARNIGLKQATGNLIGFVDSDDYIENDYFETLAKGLQENKASLVCGCPSETKDFEIITKEQAIIRTMGGDLMTVVWNKLFRVSVLEGVFFPEGQVHEEIEFNRKYFQQVSSVAVIRCDGYKYTLERTGNTNSRFEQSRLDTYPQVLDFIADVSKAGLVEAKRAVILFGLVNFRSMYEVATKTGQDVATLKKIHRCFTHLFKMALYNHAFKGDYKRLARALLLVVAPPLYIKRYSS